MRDCHPVNDIDDLSYAFVIGGDGNVYEGRGFGIRGEHSYST